MREADKEKMVGEHFRMNLFESLVNGVIASKRSVVSWRAMKNMVMEGEEEQGGGRINWICLNLY